MRRVARPILPRITPHTERVGRSMPHMPSDNSDAKTPIRASRRLAYNLPHTVREALMDIAESTDAEQDHYGSGEVIETLERRVAELLGKEAAVFMPSGTMAQQIALRIWADRAGITNVAFHPTCHLELHEQDAYRRLHGLSSTLLGTPDRLFTIDDLNGLHEPVSTILFELPQREIGGYLPPWDDLVEMTSWARERSIRLHLDGARLWETRPFYGKAYAEIAALFDSVYVSFYKILGGIAGAALAGPADVIDMARVWRHRHGGTLVHLYPLAVSADLGLDRRLDKMGDYHAKAVEIAAVLSSLPGVSVRPDPPHTNMMHVYLEGDVERLMAARKLIIEEADTELFGSLVETAVPGVHRFEFTVGDATLEFDADEIRQLFMRLLSLADK
jgi:threonine aldolase